MVDTHAVQQLQQQAASALLDVARSGAFVSVELFWSELAGSSTATLTAVDAGGTSTMLKTPNIVFDTLEELRGVMAEPDRGAWLSMSARVTRDGGVEFEFNHDRRPYWNAPDLLEPTAHDLADPNPSDEAFLEDLADHPRSPEHLPVWHPAARGSSPTPSVPEEDRTSRRPIGGPALFPASLMALASSADWVRIADAVRRHLEAVLAERSPAEGAVIVQQTYERVFTEVLASRTAAVVQRIWAPAHAAARYPPRSTDIPDDEQVENPSQALEILLEDVSDVIAGIVEHQRAGAGR